MKSDEMKKTFTLFFDLLSVNFYFQDLFQFTKTLNRIGNTTADILQKVLLAELGVVVSIGSAEVSGSTSVDSSGSGDLKKIGGY